MFLSTQFKKHWYRALLILIIVLPALVFQSIYPVVSFDRWERISESVYGKLLFTQTPKVNSTRSSEASKVVILEVDQDTLKEFGWPIDRKHYIDLFKKLKIAGHPWLLSMLNFQSLTQSKGNTKAAAAVDVNFAKSIKAYERFIGTGLKVIGGEELTSDQEELLMPRIVLSKSGVAPEELPYLPLLLTEPDAFVESQRKFGYSNRFGSEATIVCAPMYITNKAHDGQIVIPSSLVWASAFSMNSKFRTTSGAFWPRTGEQLSFHPKDELKFAYKHCLTSPSMFTSDFLKSRKIHIISLATFMNSGDTIDWTDKVVLLASADSRKFKGPGTPSGSTHKDGVVPEHQLTARFLDNLISGDTIRRDPLSLDRRSAAMPVYLSIVIIAAAFFLSPLMAILFAFATFVGLCIFGATNLIDGQYLIPIQAMTSTAFTVVGLSLLYAYLRLDGVRRQVKLSSDLRRSLSMVNTLEELHSSAFKIVRASFDPKACFDFLDYNEALYVAASNPEKAIELLGQTEQHINTPKGSEFGDIATVPTSMNKHTQRITSPLNSFEINCKLPLSSEAGSLGTIQIHFFYAAHEHIFIDSLVEIVRAEICQHWSRIKVLAQQNVADYKFLMESTRGSIMERFLSQALTQKFKDNMTMEQNLETVLTPHPSNTALMQADIRGYSDLSAKMSPIDTVKILQKYYKNVVEEAQAVAQIKLIGDCIFLFIEDDHGTDEYSPADLALQIAATLIEETNRQNEIRAKEGEEALYFGIAIHYGDVVIGNLSSDNCIDYTVIGPNVNQVARMEELTKHQEIKDIIGTNGVILSKEARHSLRKYNNIEAGMIELDKAGRKIRSFDSISEVNFLTAESALTISSDDILLKLKMAT